jgi:signal transduction histidine kinase
VPYERIYAYSAVESQPLVVGMSYELDAVLAGWYRTVGVVAGGLALVLLLIAIAVRQYIVHETHRERMRERLQQGEKLEALGQLTGGIAHDFGNVLGVVNNNIELLDRLMPNKDERVAKSLTSARRAVATGTRLTRDLMAFARKRELNVVAVDIANELSRVEPMLRHAAGPGVETDVGAEGHCIVQLDLNQLEVALINLVVNARDAMEGKGTIRVRVTCDAPPPAGARGEDALRRYARITVSDTGPGMSEEVRKRAMEPFFTTKGEQGTGLGLSQVYGFVQQVGGELTIDSALGQGTSVHMYFPATAE